MGVVKVKAAFGPKMFYNVDVLKQKNLTGVLLGNSDIKAIFMDLDGTLADSMATMGKVFQRFLELKKIDARPADFRHLRGKPLDALLKVFREQYGIEYSELQLVNEFYDLADEVYAEQTVPMPGASRLIHGASQRGVQLFIVTSARGTVVRDFLKTHGFDPFIKGVIAAEDVSIQKPDPQPYLAALDLAGLTAAHGLAVEDSIVGSLSATRAGLATWIMAPKGYSEVDPATPGVQGFVKRLDELIDLL